ncbi:MAG: tRNA pseudouridine(38-40) synthase TruA, partial [Sciscionella sp.]
RRGVDWPASLLGATRRCQEVSVAPALGLCLIAVDYPAPEELAARNERTRTVRGRPGTDAPEARS